MSSDEELYDIHKIIATSLKKTLKEIAHKYPESEESLTTVASCLIEQASKLLIVSGLSNEGFTEFASDVYENVENHLNKYLDVLPNKQTNGTCN